MAATLTAVGGCEGQPPALKPNAKRPNVARTETERGPVKLVVEVAPEPARLSDEPQLTLTIDSEPGIEVRKPPFGDAVGDFIVRNFREPLPETVGNRQIIRQVYTLEPTQAGASQINPIVVRFVDKRPAGDGKEHQIETEALTVHVISTLDSQSPNFAQLKGLQDPIPIPSPGVSHWWWVAAAAMLMVGAAMGWILRRGRVIAVPPLSPREEAERELAKLWDSRLAHAEVKSFYMELTGIVRRYLESTTGIHAPEQTTDEFLREVSVRAVFPFDSRQRLKDFLEAADLVKFAAHCPSFQDVEESFRRARMFVTATDTEQAA